MSEVPETVLIPPDGDVRAAVLAPAPILTVTLEEERPTPELHLHPGGQGFWTGRMIRELGVPVTLCAPIGGETGAVLSGLIEAAGLDLEAVPTAGSNGSYVHRRTAAGMIEVGSTPSPQLSRHETDDLFEAMLAVSLDSSLALLTGSPDPETVSPGFFRSLATDLSETDRRSIADLSGKQLAAALAGGLDLVHVDERELAEHDPRFRAGESAPGKLIEALERLRDQGAKRVILSRGARPAAVLLPSGTYRLEGPVFEEREAKGAGDSMFAGVAAALAQGRTFEDALRLGAAAGAVNVVRRGLGTGHARDLERVAKRVVLEPIGD